MTRGKERQAKEQAARDKQSYVLGAFGVLCMAVALAFYQGSNIEEQYQIKAGHGLKINVNTATADQLELLTEIGPERARSIVSYREAHGPFVNYKELVRVAGIGDKTLQKLISQVRLSDPPRDATEDAVVKVGDP